MKKIFFYFLIILSLAIIALWFSLFISYQTNLTDSEKNNLNAPMAFGGFPVSAFEYPIPPLGNGFPPSEAWPRFFINFIFWFLVSGALAIILPKRIILHSITYKISGSLAIILTAIGLLYLLIQFD